MGHRRPNRRQGVKIKQVVDRPVEFDIGWIGIVFRNAIHAWMVFILFRPGIFKFKAPGNPGKLESFSHSCSIPVKCLSF